jgi:hypothetical protein
MHEKRKQTTEDDADHTDKQNPQNDARDRWPSAENIAAQITRWRLDLGPKNESA